MPHTENLRSNLKDQVLNPDVSVGSRLATWSTKKPDYISAKAPPVLVVVEGTNDIEFLRRISKVVASIDSKLPQLDEWENDGHLIFLPFGGGSVSAWSSRLAPLKLPEFHLSDRETSPETSLRERAAQIVNARSNCRAVITRKRSLENYLHLAAISAIDGLAVEFDDQDSVTEAVAKGQFTRKYDSAMWELLPKRGQDRWSRRTKHWLNTKVVEHMTPEMLLESDPMQEIASWFRAISNLSQGSR